jgi:hypothetical protein
MSVEAVSDKEDHECATGLISRRIALINQLRGFLLEQGMVFAKTPSKLQTAMPDILESVDVALSICFGVSGRWSRSRSNRKAQLGGWSASRLRFGSRIESGKRDEHKQRKR